MNREIEFRGKKLNKSEWVYGYYQKDEIGSYIIDINADEIDKGIGYSVFENTIGQYTGLKDKNGKQIFEGDIVKVFCDCDGFFVESKYIYGKVWFSEDFLDYEINYDHIRYGCDESLCNRSDDIEVVGNIYDNKELLEMKE